ncbi:MAG: hypothetical protein R2792_10565 [Saprospiraceae bacterium]
MKNIFYLSTIALIAVAAFSCKTTSKTQGSSTINYNDLYKSWVVDTVITLKSDMGSTPNIEADKNEYLFKKGGAQNQGIRTTITSGASVDVPFTLKNGSIHFDQGATFPLMKFDKEGNLVSSNMFASLPPYTIVELSATKLTLKNEDIIVKMQAK